MRGKSDSQIKSSILHMTTEWRKSRFMVQRLPICWNGMDVSKPMAWVEPLEIEMILDDMPDWKFEIFTKLQVEKEEILYWWLLRQARFKNKQKNVKKLCDRKWNVPIKVIDIILTYSKLSIEFQPPRITYTTFNVIKNNKHMAINENGQAFCVPCTIFRINPIIKFNQCTPKKNQKHEKSWRHQKAIKLANKYYYENGY